MVAALLPGAWLLPAGSPHHAVREVGAAVTTIEAQAAESDLADPVALDLADAVTTADAPSLDDEYDAAAIGGMEEAAALAETAVALFSAPEQPVMRSAAVVAPRSAAPSPSVSDVAGRACSTAVVRGLSEQLMAEIESIRPGTVASIADIPGVETGPGTLPYLQRPAVEALRKVAGKGGRIKVNSALRSLAQQYLLHRWYTTGRCGIPLAAQPGTSHHESGLAVDIANHGQLRGTLTSNGWRWLGARDAVHFDFVGAGGTRLGGLSVLAFQRLWNRNNPHDLIPEDGAYGPATAQRLAKAPANGFALGPDTAGPTQTAAAEPRNSSATWNAALDD